MDYEPEYEQYEVTQHQGIGTNNSAYMFENNPLAAATNNMVIKKLKYYREQRSMA